MRQFKFFGRLPVPIFASVILAILFAPIAMAANTGFYAGTFDPPTQVEIARLRCALGDASVRKECAELGKSIARLVVSVNDSSDGDTLASARERALMVKKALQKYGDRVEVVTAPGNGEKKFRALLEDKNIERLVQFIDSDSYQAVKSLPINQNPKLQWMIFTRKQADGSAPALDPKTLPSNAKLFVEVEQPAGGSASAVQKVIQSGGATAGLIDPAVKAVIEKLSLYQEVSEDLAKLQKSLFGESWTGFRKDLKSACPSVLGQQACAGFVSSWEAITIVDEDPMKPIDRKSSSANLLVYKRAQSEDRWAEKFTDAALKSLRGSANYEKLKPVAEDMSSKIYQGYPEGKLFHLRKVSVPLKPGSGEAPKVSQKPVACSAPPGKYNMNIVQYTDDRFPKAFAGFLKEQFPTRSILPTDLYAHNQTVEDAYKFHQRDGFSTFYFLQTRRGQLHRNIYLAVRPKPYNYRVVFTDLRGLDQEADVFCQISHSDTFSSLRSVQC